MFSGLNGSVSVTYCHWSKWLISSDINPGVVTPFHCDYTGFTLSNLLILIPVHQLILSGLNLSLLTYVQWSESRFIDLFSGVWNSIYLLILIELDPGSLTKFQWFESRIVDLFKLVLIPVRWLILSNINPG